MYLIKQGQNKWYVTDYKVTYQNNVAILEGITKNGCNISIFGHFSIEECEEKKTAQKDRDQIDSVINLISRKK